MPEVKDWRWPAPRAWGGAERSKASCLVSPNVRRKRCCVTVFEAEAASSRLDDRPARVPIMAWARADETIIASRRRRCGSVLRSSEVGYRCGEAEQCEDGQCDRRPASGGETTEPDGIYGFCEVVGGGGDQHRCGKCSDTHVRCATLGKIQHERVDVAGSDECR